jgi:hypothetical protein
MKYTDQEIREWKDKIIEEAMNDFDMSSYICICGNEIELDGECECGVGNPFKEGGLI